MIQFRQGNQIARLFVQCLAIYSKGNLPNRLKIDKVFQILQNLLNLTESSHMHTDRGPRANSVYKLCSWFVPLLSVGSSGERTRWKINEKEAGVGPFK